jgi:indolepyruvate ferredoxin oxidoreductase alpha subunit
VLCAGCPHRASFLAVKAALGRRKATWSGDIGCYTLGNAAPLDAVDTCVCMGAGFTVPQGMHWAEPDILHLGFVGDSTFFASGITGVINAVYNRSPVKLFVLDNSTTAMTGAQPHPGTGVSLSCLPGSPPGLALSIPDILRACKVPYVATCDPFDHAGAVDAAKAALDNPGLSVLVFKAPCVALSKPRPAPQFDEGCRQCGVCAKRLGCPALADRGGIVSIDDALCNGCGLCAQICPFDALLPSGSSKEPSNGFGNEVRNESSNDSGSDSSSDSNSEARNG